MEDKARLLELENELQFHIGNLFVEKVICDNEDVVVSHIEIIKKILEEIKRLKVIE